MLTPLTNHVLGFMWSHPPCRLITWFRSSQDLEDTWFITMLLVFVPFPDWVGLFPFQIGVSLHGLFKWGWSDHPVLQVLEAHPPSSHLPPSRLDLYNKRHMVLLAAGRRFQALPPKPSKRHSWSRSMESGSSVGRWPLESSGGAAFFQEDTHTGSANTEHLWRVWVCS